MQSLDTRTIVNHMALVIDESSSMSGHARTVVSVVDTLVAHLADQSKLMDQETRISVYAFNSQGTQRCLVFDTDVLRIPSIAGKYHPTGLTALIDCTCLAIDELQTTSVIHGEHSFVVFSITDGQENASRQPSRLKGLVAGLPSEWTVVAYVPDDNGRRYAERYGWDPGSIQQWDTAASFENVGRSLREAADVFMTARSQGVRGFSAKTGGSLFKTAAVSQADVKKNLTPLTPGSYTIETAPYKMRIDDFVPAVAKMPFVVGRAYYELDGHRPEIIQPQKEVAILTSEGKVYTGRAARQLLGLPDYHIKVKPGDHPGTTIFIQSTSYNRNVNLGQKVLVLR